MTISCIISSLRLGGAERQLVGLAALLRKAGHVVEVVTYRHGDFYAPELEAAGVMHTHITPRGGDLRLVRQIVSHLKENGTQAVISFLVGANIKACLAHMVYPGFKLIVSERNCNTLMFPHDRFRFTLFRMEADAVVCNSFAQTAFVSRHCPGLRLRLETIPNFVDSDIFRPSPAAKGGSGPMKVLTVARLHPRKNAVRLIKAAADPSLSGLEFDWYGAAGDSRYARRCGKLIARLGIGSRFRIHPATDNPADLYGKFDAFCLPSFYEGTPNSLAEALTTGMPAICSDVSDNARYVIPGRNGFLFNPYDRRSIVKALQRLASLDCSSIAEYGAESLAIAAENFPKSLFIKRYIELLRGLEGGPEKGL
ncbi:MAG: glycosyltransferase [Bacteroidales bacterium]|nr:glycosyltransferase [Bacteroidales bacterium]